MNQMSLQGKAVPALEEKFIKLDGTPIYVEATAMPMLYQGNPSIMVVIKDITERKSAEEKLKATHQRLLDIIEFLPDPVFVVNKERTVIAWNRAVETHDGRAQGKDARTKRFGMLKGVLRL